MIEKGKRPPMRFVASLAAALAGFSSVIVPVSAQQTTTDDFTVTSIDVTARRVDSFQRGIGNKRSFGRLTFRGGLVLTSADNRFGGLSGLILSPDGRKLLAVSDQGNWLSADLAYEGKAPSGIVNARMGPLLALNGRPLRRKRDADAEDLALVSGSLSQGTAVVAYERNHRLARHPIVDGGLGRPTSLIALPSDARLMKSNSGLEAVTVLRGGPMRGAILAFAENLPDGNGHHSGWILGKGAAQRLALKDIGGFAITGVASLGDGSALLLERRFRYSEGVKMRLRHISAADLRPGRVIEGETLIDADMSYDIDNMEAVAVHTAAGETVVTLLSDNNFNRFFQRNLLLQFTLHPAGSKATSR